MHAGRESPNAGNGADLAHIRTAIASIKTNSGFTDAIGADLGSSAAPALSTRTPTRHRSPALS